MTTVSVTSPLKNVIGIKLTHFDQLPKDPSFDLNDQHVKLATTTDDNTLRIQSGDLSANFPIDGSDFEINFEANGQVITKSEPNAEGKITKTDDQTHYMREQLSIGIDELVYGLGERFTSFVKNGQVVDIVQKDAVLEVNKLIKTSPSISLIRAMVFSLTSPKRFRLKWLLKIHRAFNLVLKANHLSTT